MGQGTAQNKWSPGNDGVRITVVDAESGVQVSAPLDFSNREQSGNILHFGKVNKLQYRGGTGLSIQSGSYSCIKPVNSMPSIVSSTGRNNIEAVKTLIRRAMDKGFYEGVNLSLAYCDDCGHQELEMDVCPKCGSRNLTKIDRMNGYLSYSRVHGDTRLNDAKMAEIAERKSM